VARRAPEALRAERPLNGKPPASGGSSPSNDQTLVLVGATYEVREVAGRSGAVAPLQPIVHRTGLVHFKCSVR
jgi:hypothetical protein